MAKYVCSITCYVTPEMEEAIKKEQMKGETFSETIRRILKEGLGW